MHLSVCNRNRIKIGEPIWQEKNSSPSLRSFLLSSHANIILDAFLSPQH